MKTAVREEFSTFWPISKPADVTFQRPQLPSRGGPAEEKWLNNLLRARRNRGEFFNPDLFADPAWDMLLELQLAEISQRRVSVSKLCMASNSPLTTGLRWISALERKGLVTKFKHPTDGRIVFVRLSDAGRAAMDAFLSSLPDSIYPFQKQ